MNYAEARDAYGRLDKAQKDAVLDKVSARNVAHSGAEAEQAFVDAVIEVQKEATYRSMYGGMVFALKVDGPFTPEKGDVFSFNMAAGTMQVLRDEPFFGPVRGEMAPVIRKPYTPSDPEGRSVWKVYVFTPGEEEDGA